MLTETIKKIATLHVGDVLTCSENVNYLVVETLFPPTGLAGHHTSRFNLFNQTRLCVCAFEAETLEGLTERLTNEKSFSFNVSKRVKK